MLGEGIWGRNDAAGDEILHAVGTCDPHFVRTVPVEIQGEGRRRVTQILLNRLDVVSGAEGVDRVSVPQVVNANLFHTGTLAAVFHLVIQKGLCVGKDSVARLELIALSHVVPQAFPQSIWNRDDAVALWRLGRGDDVLPGDPLVVLRDGDCALLEVNVCGRQRQQRRCSTAS